jgi:hypothetical protein
MKNTIREPPCHTVGEVEVEQRVVAAGQRRVSQQRPDGEQTDT